MCLNKMQLLGFLLHQGTLTEIEVRVPMRYTWFSWSWTGIRVYNEGLLWDHRTETWLGS